jgi:hypothetical protein
LGVLLNPRRKPDSVPMSRIPDGSFAYCTRYFNNIEAGSGIGVAPSPKLVIATMALRTRCPALTRGVP